MIASLVFAHQGNWDEFLYIIVPVALMVVGVRWAEGKARRRAQEAESEAAGSDDAEEADRPTEPPQRAE